VRTRREVAFVSGLLVFTLVVAACSSSDNTGGDSTDAAGGTGVFGSGSGCVSFAGANENVFNWKDVPRGVYVGDSPIGDQSKMYAIRIGDAVWLTSVPPDGSDGGLTLPVNDAARSYDPKLGADVAVESSAWVDLAALAEDASAACA
jgi:hypothetical protein